MKQPFPDTRAYSPEILVIMTAAFDRVFGLVADRMNGTEDDKCRLARSIIWQVDVGERDPERLANAALRELN